MDQRPNIDTLFCPRSIAVVGVSKKEKSVGRSVFSNILFGGYTGILYPVNPKYVSILGVKCNPDIIAVPDPIDLVVNIVSPEITPNLNWLPAEIWEHHKKQAAIENYIKELKYDYSLNKY